MSGKLPPGCARKVWAIINENDWVFIGSRFVSPLGCDVGKVMTFESPGVAEGVAKHLRSIEMARGIRSRQAEWMVQKLAKFPVIVGFAPGTAKLGRPEALLERQKRPRTHNGRALLLSEQREHDALLETG